MISIREIQSVEYAAQIGGEVSLIADHLHLHASRRRIPLLPDRDIEVRIDSCTFRDGMLTCRGWGYEEKSRSPLKRVFALVEGRLIGPASPALRIDVRQVVGVNYDHCGFQLKGTSPIPLADGDTVDLLTVTSTGLHHVTSTCSSDLSTHLRPGDNYETRAAGIDFRTAGVKRSCVNLNGVRHSVDALKVSEGRLRARGWCVVTSDPDRSLVVALGVGGTIVSPSTRCEVPRPDVSMHFGLASRVHAYGFNLECDADMVASVDRSALELVVMSIDGDRRCGAAVPAFRVKVPAVTVEAPDAREQSARARPRFRWRA